jgi:hypothetical protein
MGMVVIRRRIVQSIWKHCISLSQNIATFLRHIFGNARPIDIQL